MCVCVQPVFVETPQGGVYEGKRLSGKRVSPIRHRRVRVPTLGSAFAALGLRRSPVFPS